jgi:hypothetical protein
MVTPPADYVGFALSFGKALLSREYSRAFAMTSTEYQRGITLEQMGEAFEAIVPPDWGTAGPVEVGQTMDDWPGKQASDAGWAYVSIGGDVYSESVIVIVAHEDDAMKVRDVEFGRP